MVNSNHLNHKFEEDLKDAFSHIKIAVHEIKLQDSYLGDITTRQAVEIYTIEDMVNAAALVRGKGINVIITSNPVLAKPLVETGIPIISLLRERNLDKIVGCYTQGFFDAVWEKEDLVVSIYYAFLAGKKSFETGLRKGIPESIYDIRKEQPFILLANRDKKTLISSAYAPNSTEIKKARQYGFVIKDFGSASFQSLITVIDALQPKKILVNSCLVPDPKDVSLRALAEKSQEVNPYAEITVIHDGLGLGEIADLVADKSVPVSAFIRSGTLDDLMKLHLLREKGRAPADYAMELSNPVDAYHEAQGLHAEIQRRFFQDRWTDETTQNMVQSAAAYYRRFLELVKHHLKASETPTIRFSGDACATGIFEALDPDRKYDPNDILRVWKHTDHQSAWQLFFDSTKSLEYGHNFQQPMMMVPIPISENECFLVQDCIVGPTVRDLFYRLYLSEERKPRSKDNINALRSSIYDMEIERLLFFQEHYTTLNRPLTKFVNMAALQSPANIGMDYLGNIFSALQNLSAHTDVKFTERENEGIIRTIKDYDCGGILTPETLRRNLAASFRNSILRTYHRNVSLTQLFLGMEKSSDRNAYWKENVFRIDQAPKYSHLLEDLWEMLDFYEAQLAEGEKQKRAAEVIEQHPTIKGKLEEANGLIRLYRAVREADLYLSVYIPKLCAFRLDKSKSDEDFATERTLYTNAARHHIQMAKIACESLDRGNPLRGLCPYISRAADFSSITYFENIDKR